MTTSLSMWEYIEWAGTRRTKKKKKQRRGEKKDNASGRLRCRTRQRPQPPPPLLLLPRVVGHMCVDSNTFKGTGQGRDEPRTRRNKEEGKEKITPVAVFRSHRCQRRLRYLSVLGRRCTRKQWDMCGACSDEHINVCICGSESDGEIEGLHLTKAKSHRGWATEWTTNTFRGTTGGSMGRIASAVAMAHCRATN